MLQERNKQNHVVVDRRYTRNICSFLLKTMATQSGCDEDHCNVLISPSALYARMGSETEDKKRTKTKPTDRNVQRKRSMDMCQQSQRHYLVFRLTRMNEKETSIQRIQEKRDHLDLAKLLLTECVVSLSLSFIYLHASEGPIQSRGDLAFIGDQAVVFLSFCF